jgi:PmbA protein
MSLEECWISLKDMVHKAFERLEKRNVACAEAFFTSTETTEVTIRNSEVFTQNKAQDSGVGFRVAVSGSRVGFACTNNLNFGAITESAEKALTIAKVSSEVPSFTLPEPRKPSLAKELFDPHVAEVDVEEAVDIANRVIKAAEGFDKRVIAKDGRVIFQHCWRGIVNSLGVDFEERETRAVVYLGGSGEEKGEVTGSCADFLFNRSMKFDPEKVGENVAKMVIQMFKAKSVKSFCGTAIFAPMAVSGQLVDVLVDALKGENVVAERSPWVQKLGETIASENITVVDNPLLEGGFSSRSFDDEGFASQETTVIENGRLEAFLHNATTANALKVKNTGNASRFPGSFDMTRWIVGNGYRAKPEVYPSNLIICKGNKTREQLLSEIKRGVLIEAMAGFPQAGSGLISAQLSQAYYVEDGDVKHAIKGGMISGVAFDWFKNVSGVGNDQKQLQNCVVPSLRVEGVNVVGV